MSGRQAKILSKDNCDDLLVFASTTRHPLRDRLIVLLSVKAGLRAAEIANLTWEMVLTPDRRYRTRNRTARPGGQEIGRAADPDPSRAA